jgi:hypothetical protein
MAVLSAVPGHLTAPASEDLHPVGRRSPQHRRDLASTPRARTGHVERMRLRGEPQDIVSDQHRSR